MHLSWLLSLAPVKSRVHGQVELRNGRERLKDAGLLFPSLLLKTGRGENHPGGIVGKQSMSLDAKLGACNLVTQVSE